MIQRQWNSVIADILKAALPGSALKAVQQEVETGKASLWAFNQGELFAVTRYEIPAREFVIVAVAGRNLRQHTDAIYAMAKAMGAKTIRFHTRHPKRLTKGMAGWPFSLVKKPGILSGESIYRMAVF